MHSYTVQSVHDTHSNKLFDELQNMWYNDDTAVTKAHPDEF